MAESPGHRFGQIIGEVLEAAVEPLLSSFAAAHDLYLDQKGERPCRKGVKCTWVDLNKNKHDLDFVLERGGNRDKQGLPVAFIETAWRRYTKHSRNKAQEIQGAIMPLVETFRHVGPFTGAVLAGVFTEGALTQLTSLGFTVLFFPYETVIASFAKFGIDARFDENTPDSDLAKKVAAYDALSVKKRQELATHLLAARAKEVSKFMKSLEIVVLREVERVIILPLHGVAQSVATAAEGIEFINRYSVSPKDAPVNHYEIQVRYNNGNVIEGKFGDKPSAITFLQAFVAPTA